MPELPEVETTRRGILPLIAGHTIDTVHVRQRRLRWPIPRSIDKQLPGATIVDVSRRAKYLLIHTSAGVALLHLGMSGSLRVVPTNDAFQTHDRFSIDLDNGQSLRLRDPRRFGAVLWAGHQPENHKLLQDLGPEPLGPDFSGELLFRRSRGRKRAIREFLLDGHIVAGIGNIYANEALFLAGIRPARAAGRISRSKYDVLGQIIREVLSRAIAAGGTTLRDFQQADGRPGYFRQTLHVYGREGLPCSQCGRKIKRLAQCGRSAFFCTNCQL